MSIRDARGQRGLSLVEQIVAIVIIGAAAAGVMAALATAFRGSADPMIQKQALAIAEAVLEEVQLQPFTYCDPEDTNAGDALDAAGCTAAEAIGPENAAPYGPETRSDASTPYDNVNDYHGFSMTGMTNIAGVTVPGLAGYTATVTVAAQGVAAFGGKPAIPAAEALLVTVTVTGPGNTTAVLHGYRTRYAPNALP